MILFIELHTYLRALFMTLLFSSLCLSLSLTFLGFTHKVLIPRLTAPFCAVVSGIFLLPYAAFIHAQRNLREPSYGKYMEIFLEMPAVVVISVALILVFMLVALTYYFFIRSKNSISLFSVKASVDKLKTGICFSYKNGMVKLINEKMDELHRIITGYELRSTIEFLEILKDGELQPGVERLSLGEKTILRLPDMSVWSFSIKELPSMIEITAADTTDLYRISEELTTSNCELQLMNERLKKYGLSVDELTKARERLDTKHRIHAELGKVLLATRLFLQNNDGEPEKLIEMWSRNITVLGVENDTSTDYNALKGLLSTARTVGIDVNISGDIPEKENVKRLFLDAIAESLTNAVRHADADYLNVAFSQDIFCFSAKFCNKMKNNEKEISEGGGLSSLRRKTELLGGNMTITAGDEFILVLKVPK